LLKFAEAEQEALKAWAFRELFELEKTANLPAIDLPTACIKLESSA
jgi:hypothetical protein